MSSLVPLPELLGEIAASGPASKTVERSYGRLLSALGSELAILQSVPLEDIARTDSSLLAEAIARLRAGQVIRDAGYDGEYGVIRLFQDDELRRRTAGGLLFEGAALNPPPERGRTAPKAPGGGPSASAAPSDPHPTASRSTSPFQGEEGESGLLLPRRRDSACAARSSLPLKGGGIEWGSAYSRRSAELRNNESGT